MSRCSVIEHATLIFDKPFYAFALINLVVERHHNARQNRYTPLDIPPLREPHLERAVKPSIEPILVEVFPPSREPHLERAVKPG